MEEKAQSKQKKWVIPALLLVLILLLVVVIVLLSKRTVDISDGDVPKIGYAAEATVMTDQESLQASIDEALANARDNMVSLEYKNHAYSTDGKTFSCYIVNAASNLYDMFLTIYADEEMTDQVFLSGLVPPGSGFEEITLDHELPEGDHTVCVAVTQVDTAEDGTQVIKNQVVHTMEFHVTK